MTSATPGTPWYLYPITQGFNGRNEKGVDLGVPYHTPVTPLFPGTVTAVDTGPYGQEVDVSGLLNGQRVTASYVHIDQALVGVGQSVGVGSVLGVSGGQLRGGYHPASPAYSTGPHLEFSLWPNGTTPYGGRPYNPMAFIGSVQANPAEVTAQAQGFGASLTGGLSSLFGTFGAGASSVPSLLSQQASAIDPATLANAISSGVAGGVSTGVASGVASGMAGGVAGGLTGAGHTLLQALHAANLPDLLWRAGLIVVGIGLLWIVGSALAGGATRRATDSVVNSAPAQTAKQVAGLAGTAGALK